METDVQDLMLDLHEDHRNMIVVLDLLDGLVRDMESGADPDFELIDEIMRYMTVYPDAVHHPKEDVVYAQLREQRPDLVEDLDHVPDEHREIARLGAQLRNDVEAINAGAAVRRRQMVRDASAYVEKLRRHIHWEESEFFARIDRMMEAEPKRVDVSAYDHIRDPVFELEIEAGFRRLIASLPADG